VTTTNCQTHPISEKHTDLFNSYLNSGNSMSGDIGQSSKRAV